MAVTFFTAATTAQYSAIANVTALIGTSQVLILTTSGFPIADKPDFTIIVQYSDYNGGGYWLSTRCINNCNTYIPGTPRSNYMRLYLQSIANGGSVTAILQPA